ncbi:MAG: hypothetical protein ABEJ44_02890 [Halanaeroarchaeum sp.]
MSTDRPQREVAHRIFAAEFEDSEYTYAESDEERAPNYVVTPTGARVNRLFVVGVLTEVEAVSDDVLRARVVDPTGAFVVYAGQYQPEALAFFERADPPAFVAVTGKARTFQPDDADVIYTSIRPESANEVTDETRDRWVVQTAERTIERVETFAASLDLSERGDALEEALRGRDVDASLAAGIPRAIEYYDTTSGYLAAIREMALDAARVVADELDEVEGPTIAPDEEEGEPLEFDHSLPEPGGTVGDEAPSTADDQPTVAERGTSATTDENAEESSASEEEPGTQAAGQPPREAEEPTESGSAGESGESVDAEPVEETGGVADERTADAETAAEGTTEPGEADVAPGDPDEMYELSESEREEVKSEFGVDFETGNEVGEPGEAGIETPEPDDADVASSESNESIAPEEGTEETDEAEAGDQGETEDEVVAGGGAKTETEAETEDQVEDRGEAETEEEVETEDDVEAEGGREIEEVAATERGAATEEEAATEETGEAGVETAEKSTDVDLEDAVVDAMGELDEGDGAPRSELVETVADRHAVGEDAVEDAIQDALMGGRCYEPAEDRLTPI